ncbi:MAG TPA: TolC family protein [Gemmatimonadaceae bacterium]
MCSRPRLAGRASALVAFALGLAACAPPRIDGEAGAPASPSSLWPVPAPVQTPPPPAKMPVATAITAALASDASAAGSVRTLGLPDVIDLVLRNNPATRESWALAQSAAAAYGSARGALLPTVALDVNATRSGGGAFNTFGGTGGGGGQTGSVAVGTTARTQLSQTFSLSYLLLDLGGRSGTIEAARQRAIAANLTHNSTVLDAVLQVESMLFSYLAARALRDEQIVSVSEAQNDLTAASERERLGVATIQDVLQTRTALAQARVQLATFEGNLQAARGNLAFAMGLPANARFEIPAITASDSVADVLASVDTLINRATTQRPELAEARAQASALGAEVRVARSAALPTLSLRTSNGISTTYAATNTVVHPFSIGLAFSVPIFNGFSSQYDILAARGQYEAGQARVVTLQQQISVQVFTSYFQLRASTERVRRSTELLATAEQSATVALARYREGVGTIIDVLLGRSALATARAESVQSRWEWRLALAQLAHDAGMLDLRGRPNLPLGPR